MKFMSCWVLSRLLDRYVRGEISMEEIQKLLDGAPESDLERVVRCKDCIHRRNGDADGAVWCCIRAETKGVHDYCSDGVPGETVEEEREG